MKIVPVKSIIIKKDYYFSESEHKDPIIKLYLHKPYVLPVVSFYIDFKVDHPFRKEEEKDAIHILDESMNTLYYCNIDIDVEKFAKRNANRMRVLIDVVLPENVGNRLSIVFKNFSSNTVQYINVATLYVLENYWKVNYIINTPIDVSSKNDDISIFFIIGPPKSGTTWLHHILNNHPDVICFNETLNINASTPLELFEEEFNFFVPYSYLWKGLKAIGEKNPAITPRIDRLLSIYEKLKIICIFRNPLDVFISRIFHEVNLYLDGKIHLSIFDEKHFKELIKFTEGSREGSLSKEVLDILIQDFCMQTKAVVELLPKYNSLKDRFLVVRYEDLIANFESEIERIFNFLNLNYNQDLISFIKENTSFRALSNRERGKEDKRSFYRKGIVGDWANYFNISEVKYILKETCIKETIKNINFNFMNREDDNIINQFIVEFSHLSNLLASKEEEIQDLSSQLEAVRSERDRLSEALAQKDKEISDLIAQLEEKNKLYTEALGQLEAIRSERDNLQQSLVQREEELLQKQKEIERLNGVVASIGEELRHLSDHLEATKAEKEKLEKALAQKDK